MADRYELRLACLRVAQGKRSLYAFAVDGKKLHDFATVSRIGRDQASRVAGYQRPDVIKHVRGIQRYLESPDALLPNALVVAFDGRVRFEPVDQTLDQAYSTPGVLVIPVDESAPDKDKPGWIVDGQQRSAAIRDARIHELPVCVVGFIAEEAEQHAQFILVNNTRPLPKGLIHELLPATRAELAVPLMRRRVAAEMLDRLNVDADSPFRGLIATPTRPDGIIKDNAVLRMVENSIHNGALYHYRRPGTADADTASMLTHLKMYWTTVANTFPEAWALPPRQSRLTHGVGIAAMGYVMDELTDSLKLARIGKASARVSILKDAAWTTGEWTMDSGTRRWNSLQNTPNDIRQLTEHLLSLVRVEPVHTAKATPAPRRRSRSTSN